MDWALFFLVTVASLMAVSMLIAWLVERWLR
jgi:hypothetical protein